MKKFFKKSFLSALVLTLLLSYNNIQKVSAKQKQLPKEQIMEIVDPHIKKVWQGFRIENEKELVNKIGVENVESLRKHLHNQNIRLSELRNRHAIGPIEDIVLNFYKVKKEVHWFGDRFIAENERDAENIVNAFSIIKTMKTVLTSGSAGAGFKLGNALMESGVPHAIAAAVVSYVGGAVLATKFGLDVITCDLVITRVNNKAYSFNFRNEKMFVDINRWYLDVRVY